MKCIHNPPSGELKQPDKVPYVKPTFSRYKEAQEHLNEMRKGPGTRYNELQRTAEMLADDLYRNGPYYMLSFLWDAQYDRSDVALLMAYMEKHMPFTTKLPYKPR